MMGGGAQDPRKANQWTWLIKKTKVNPQYIPNKLPERYHPDRDTHSDSDIEEVSTSLPSFIVLKSIGQKPSSSSPFLQ